MAGEEELNRAMGKLVLFLADGTTLDIPLDHERVTVGRRSANDVCLPYAAVSGAHAVFVTTADGVVVEDLGSTNGTTVNGARMTKQVLNEGDRIDIGRQRFVFLADVNAAVPVPAPRISAGRRAGDERGGVGNDPTIESLPLPVAEAPRAFLPAPGSGDALASAAPARTTESWLSEPGPNGSPSVGNPAPAFVGPILKVLTGPNAGRTLMLSKDEVLIGRVGLQVVAVRKAGDAYRLFLAEGAGVPRVNGVPVPPEGVMLQPGDAIEIADVQMALLTDDGAELESRGSAR